MKVIPASYQLIKEPDILKKIERIARVCYKSEDKITENSYQSMLDNLIKRKHFAMLEHGTIVINATHSCYLLLKRYTDFIMQKIPCKDEKEKEEYNVPKRNYFRFTETFIPHENWTRYLVSANLRAWNDFFSNYTDADLPKQLYDVVAKSCEYIIPPLNKTRDISRSTDVFANIVTPKILKTYVTPEERLIHETFSVLFTVDRGITHELVRMRECSFAQESTRYCNYSKGKYGNEITVIKPCFFKEESPEYQIWENTMRITEENYNKLTKEYDIPAQQARDLLPTSLKSDIIVTANLQEWRHIFQLRACDMTGVAHPQMKEVMIPLLKEMQQIYPFAFGDLKPAE